MLLIFYKTQVYFTQKGMFSKRCRCLLHNRACFFVDTVKSCEGQEKFSGSPTKSFFFDCLKTREGQGQTFRVLPNQDANIYVTS